MKATYSPFHSKLLSRRPVQQVLVVESRQSHYTLRAREGRVEVRWVFINAETPARNTRSA
eukprot:scaffold39137_cov17-Prasinocladus_malaysianus.AAC.1